MPAYPWMITDKLTYESTPGKIITLRKLGVPYPEGYEYQASFDAKTQAQTIADNLKNSGVEVERDAEIVALIAYLQRLGTDIKASASK